jgi:hypothetical protein
MKRVIIESPYRGANQAERLRNASYLKRCIRDCIMHNESPYASHGLLPGALDEDKAQERLLGIQAGYEWWFAAEAIIFYVDYGWSTGMTIARERCGQLGMSIEIRTLPAPDDIPLNDLIP